MQFRISLCQWLAVPSCLSVLACPGVAILQEASKEENCELGTVEDNTENEGVEQPRSSTKMSIGKDEEQRALGAKVLDQDTRIYTFGFVNCMFICMDQLARGCISVAGCESTKATCVI